MELESMSAPESLFAEVAWNDNSYQMIGFNVNFYVRTLSLFSTHFAQISEARPIAIYFV